MMTSRERVLTALECRQPDRVPFLELSVDKEFGNRYLGIPSPQKSQGLGLGDEPVIVQSLFGGADYDALTLADALNLDGIGVSFWIKHMGVQAESEGHHMISGGLISTKEDLQRIRLPDPDDPELYKPVREFIEKYRPSDKAIFAVLNLGSDPTILSMGFEHFCIAALTDRELVESLFELYTAWYEKVVQNLCAMDFDFLWTTDDIAFKTSTYVDPEMIRELFMPYYHRVASKFTKPWIFHSDGDINPILDDLIDLGMNGLHPIEPGPMNLASLKQRYGNRICFCGHIDMDELSQGTPQKVDQLVKQAIRDAGEGGGYVCGSSNSIAYYCQVENVKAMKDAILKYGQY